MFSGKSAAVQIREYLFLNRAALLLQDRQVSGEIFIYGSFDPVPEVHMDPGEERIVRFRSSGVNPS